VQTTVTRGPAGPPDHASGSVQAGSTPTVDPPASRRYQHEIFPLRRISVIGAIGVSVLPCYFLIDRERCGALRRSALRSRSPMTSRATQPDHCASVRPDRCEVAMDRRPLP